MIIKKILNPFSSLIVSNRYKTDKNPYKEFDLIKKDAIIPKPYKGSILIGPIRMSGVAHVFEGLLAYSLSLKGYKVYALMCGQALEVCESKDLGKFSEIKCCGCFKEQKLFCKTYNIEPIFINDMLSSAEKIQISKAANSISLESMRNPEGVDFTGEISSGLMRILKNSNVLLPEFLPLLKKYAKTAMITYKATKNAISIYKFNNVIMSHGVYSTWGAMIRACEDLDIRTVVWGRGYVGKGNIIATHKKSYLFQNTIEPISNYINHELTNDERLKTIEYIKNKRNPKSKVDYINYYDKDNNISKSINLYEELNIPKHKKIFGMFPNIPWDGQLFSSSDSYPNINKFVKSTIDWFKNNSEVHLVIRAHPAELHSRSKNQLETFSDILEKIYPQLPSNITFLDADSHLSSYQIEEHIEVALLYAGTISLEFVINKTAVIQTGKNFSSNKGFVFEPENDQEYYSLLNKFKNNTINLTNEMYENALKYVHHWIFKRHIPETLIKLKDQLIFDGFYFKKSSDLNNNKELNWFINKMENEEDFVFDA